MRDTSNADVNYEVECNNRARVPENPAIIAGWSRDAKVYREAEKDRLNVIAYGAGERQKIDLFSGGGTGPIVVFIHGGYWQALDGSSSSHLARGLNGHGISVAIPTYDLCPDVSIADILEQMRVAARLLHQRTGRSLVAAGHSAGGHLAACLLAQEDFVPSAYAISGLFDLTPLVGTSVNAKLGLDEAEARRLSPVTWTPQAGKQLDLIVGADESVEYHRQSREMAVRWGEGGVATRYEISPGLNHFTVVAPLADARSAMMARLAALASAQ